MRNKNTSSPKFWNFVKDPDSGERELFLEGDITSGGGWFFDNDSTYNTFKQELYAGTGKLTLWVNSFGGEIVTASQIYAAILDYPYEVTVKISGVAASSASFIAMAGDKVLMSPTAVMFIHNPITFDYGYASDLRHTADTLDEFKEAIINAYEIKTKLPRAEISRLMDEETTMSANTALEKGFADGLLEKETGGATEPTAKTEKPTAANVTEKALKNLKNLRNALDKLTRFSVEIEEDDGETPKPEEKPATEKTEETEEPDKTTTETGETTTEENVTEEDPEKNNTLSVNECYARLETLKGAYLI